MTTNINSYAIATSSICEPLDIVTSRWSIVLTLYLWTLSSSQWRCQPGRFSMAAHRHDRRGIYRCLLLRFRGRIEIDHSYGLCCRGLGCHSRHSTCGAGPTRAVSGVAAQTTPAQTGSCSIPITHPYVIDRVHWMCASGMYFSTIIWCNDCTLLQTAERKLALFPTCLCKYVSLHVCTIMLRDTITDATCARCGRNWWATLKIN